MSNITDPIKEAFGKYLQGFYAQIDGDTNGLREYASRGFSKCFVLAPGRMIDQLEDMLRAYRKNDNSQDAQPKTPLPIIIVAMSKDFMPSGPEFGPNISDEIDVVLPSDPKNRTFRLRVTSKDVRTQLAVIAADEPTANSLSLQLHTYVSARKNRNFMADFLLAGFKEPWPVQIENPDLPAPAAPAEDGVKNITVNLVDLTCRASIPLLRAPKSTEQNDGQGEGVNQDQPWDLDYDPPGYLVANEARIWQEPRDRVTGGIPDHILIELRQDQIDAVATGDASSALHTQVHTVLPGDQAP